MQKWIAALICALLIQTAQATAFPAAGLLTPDSTIPASRKWIAAGGTVIMLGGSLALFVQGNNYEYSPKFHFNRTGVDYLGMDKLIHAQLSYTTGRLLFGTLRWAGTNETKSAWLATGGSFAFSTIKEYLDGHHRSWGWSWSDVGSNFAGSALFGVQQLAWGEQRIQLKFSGLPRHYTQPDIERQVSFLYGNGLKRAIKDYNQHTYWLSANLQSLGLQGMPPWLNLAVGLGAENLYGQKQNTQTGPDGSTFIFDRRELPRRRQWYLSPDVDLTKIKTNSRFLRTAFYVLNSLKFPLPALELTGGKLKVKAVVF